MMISEFDIAIGDTLYRSYFLASFTPFLYLSADCFLMVYVFFNRTAEKLKPEYYDQVMEELSSKARALVSRLKDQGDRCRTLTGKLLLSKALGFLDMQYELREIKYSSYQRPYFDDSLDFSIAHSASFSVCAISKTHRAGIDIEKIKEIHLEDFRNAFNEAEWNRIVTAGSKEKTFYEAWTKKEAFLKAIGTGLHQSLHSMDMHQSKLTWENKEWTIQELLLDAEYSCHLCVDDPLAEIRIEEISFE